MTEHAIELVVGEVVAIGSWRVTVLEVDGDEVTFRIDSEEGNDTSSRIATARLPR